MYTKRCRGWLRPTYHAWGAYLHCLRCGCAVLWGSSPICQVFLICWEHIATWDHPPLSPKVVPCLGSFGKLFTTRPVCLIGGLTSIFPVIYFLSWECDLTLFIPLPLPSYLPSSAPPPPAAHWRHYIIISVCISAGTVCCMYIMATLRFIKCWF